MKRKERAKPSPKGLFISSLRKETPEYYSIYHSCYSGMETNRPLVINQN